MVSRLLIILIIVGLMPAKGKCQSTVQKNVANRPPYTNRLPNCATPKGYTGSYQHTVTFDEFSALKTAVQRLEVELGAIARERGIRGLTGPQGRPGPPGPAGPPGPPGTVGDLPERMEDVENRLNQVINHLNKQIADKKKKKPPQTPPSRPAGETKAAAIRTDEKNRTPWITKLLTPLAGLVGTAYAGPLGGAIATAFTGYAGWFLFGRKKKSPQQQRRYQEQRPPPVGGYRGNVVQNDGSDEYVEIPAPDLYREAVQRAARGETGVLGDQLVGVSQLQWIANKYAIENNQV